MLSGDLFAGSSQVRGRGWLSGNQFPIGSAATAYIDAWQRTGRSGDKLSTRLRASGAYSNRTVQPSLCSPGNRMCGQIVRPKEENHQNSYQQLSNLKTTCTKFDVSWNSAPDNTGGTNSAPQDVVSGFL